MRTIRFLLRRFAAQRLLGLAIVVSLGFTIGVLVAGPIYADASREAIATAAVDTAPVNVRNVRLSFYGDVPRILLADEPTAELDSESADKVLETLQGVNREFGVTVVTVTHDLRAARRARRQLRLRDGQLVVEGMPSDPVAPDGRLRLPREALDALGDLDLEVEVREDGEVRIRRRGEGGIGRVE